MTLAEPQRAQLRDQGISKFAGRAPFRLHIDLGEVIAGPGLEQIEAFCVLAAELTETEVAPTDVAEVPMGAGHHKANRNQRELAFIVLVRAPVRDAAIVEMDQGPGTAGNPESHPLTHLLSN